MKKNICIKPSEKERTVTFDIFKNLILTFLFTLVLILLEAFLFNLWKIPQNNIKTTTYFVYYISFLLCGLISGLINKSEGLKNGLINSFLWIIFLLFIGLVDGIDFSLFNIIRMIIGVIISMFGGILGVNYSYSVKIKKKQKHK